MAYRALVMECRDHLKKQIIEMEWETEIDTRKQRRGERMGK